MSDPLHVALGILDAYKKAGLPTPHAGSVQHILRGRGFELTAGQIQVLGCLARTTIPPAPWWYGLDQDQAQRAVERYGRGEDPSEIAVAWSITTTEARRLVYLGMAITGETYGRFFRRWEATPWEIRRAQGLLRDENRMTHKQIAERMGRAVRWVAKVAQEMEQQR